MLLTHTAAIGILISGRTPRLAMPSSASETVNLPYNSHTDTLHNSADPVTQQILIRLA